MRIRTLAGTAALSAVALTATACGSGGTGSNSQDIVIGASGPLSGPYAVVSSFYDGMNAYFDEVNADGGIDGRKIKFVVKDDQYNPSKTPAAVRELVGSDKVVMICGLSGSAPYATVNDYLGSQGVPAVPNTGADELLNDHTASTITSYSKLGQRVVNYSVDVLRARKVALAYAPDDTGIPFKDGVEAQMDIREQKLAETVEFDPSATDYSSQAAKLKASGADVVVVNHVSTVIARLINAAEDIGYKPKWALTFAAGNPELLELIGEDASSRVSIATFLTAPESKEATDFRAAMEKHFPKTSYTGNFPMQGWNNALACTELLRKAMKDSGGKAPTRDSVLKAMDKLAIDNEYLHGLDWTGDKHVGPNEMQVLGVKDGKFVQVDDYATVPDID